MRKTILALTAAALARLEAGQAAIGGLYHAMCGGGCIDSRIVYSLAAMRIRELIKALGGPREVAETIGLGIAAIGNWSLRDSIPREHHIVVWRLAIAKDVAWIPPDAEGLVLPRILRPKVRPDICPPDVTPAPKSRAKRPATEAAD